MKPRPIIHLTLGSTTSRQAVFISQCCRRTFSYASTACPSNELRPHSRTRNTLTHNARSHLQHIRYASSAAVARKPTPQTHPAPSNKKTSVPAKITASTAAVPQVRARLNPPPETYAPELNVPARGSENWFKYLYHCGRSYITFYRQGISNVRSTLRLAKQLREKAHREGVNDIPDMVKLLTRAEWQTVMRSRADKLRLPVFGALLIALGEWLPLIVVFLTPIVPEPCRIPSQTRKQLEKMENRRSERERRLAIDAARLVARDRKPGMTNPGEIRPQAMTLKSLETADLYTLLSLDVRFGVQPRIWDWLFMTPPKMMLRWGLRNRITYLQKDDWAIGRDGGFQALNEKEVERACVERGIRVLGRKEAELRKELAGWFAK